MVKRPASKDAGRFFVYLRHNQRDTISHVEGAAINIVVAHANKPDSQTFDFALPRFVIFLRDFARVRFAIDFDG